MFAELRRVKMMEEEFGPTLKQMFRKWEIVALDQILLLIIL